MLLLFVALESTIHMHTQSYTIDLHGGLLEEVVEGGYGVDHLLEVSEVHHGTYLELQVVVLVSQPPPKLIQQVGLSIPFIAIVLEQAGIH